MSAFPGRKVEAPQGPSPFHLGNPDVHSGNPNRLDVFLWYVCVGGLADGKMRKECGHMAKNRFVEVYSQGITNVEKIIVDTETGVNYLLASHDLRVGTGLTVLVDQNGKPVVTSVE